MIPLRRGHLYWTVDRAIHMPPTDTDGRKYHDRRPFLIISADSTNDDVLHPIVLGFPLSTDGTRTTRFDIQVPQGVGDLPEDCWILTTLLQPVKKSVLLERIGQLPANDTERVLVVLFKYIDALNETT